MARILLSAGGVQAPPEAQETSASRPEQQQETNALDAQIDKAQMVAENPGDAGVSPPSSGTRPSSLATTTASTAERERSAPPAGTRPSLVALATLAAFTDVFLSGLVIPLIPFIVETKAEVPHQQVQIWTSVLVSAYGGAFAAASPLVPLLTRQGPTVFAVLLLALTCAAGAFALLQLFSSLYLFILARALQGLSAAATTAACSGLLAAAASASGRARPIAGISQASIQSTAMMVAPMVAGLLSDYVDFAAVFYCAYALVALNVFLTLIAAKTTTFSGVDARDEVQRQVDSYGTIPSAPRRPSRRPSRSLSRSVSPGTRLSPGSSRSEASAVAPVAPVAWSPRLLVALYGYSVVGLLASALHSVLPLFVKRHFQWSLSATGFLFVPLSAPAAVVGVLAGALAVRVPKSARVFTAVGFSACVPAFLYLGGLRENKKLVQHAFLVTLSGISFALGLCGDPLLKEVANVLGSDSGDLLSAAAQATSLPNVANAWGSLVGPLFAGAVSWVWSWETMAQSLAIVAALTSVVSLLFLQGWIAGHSPDIRSPRDEASSDEESAPLLANDRPASASYGYAADFGKNADIYARADDSDSTSPRTHSSRDGTRRTHRRHFSVDNFSIATTAGPGSMDSATSQVRFQAALETPVHEGAASGAPRRSSTGDGPSKAGPERRYVMREAPHAPSTDPLLAAGSLYVIDEERDSRRGVETERQKRRVVVFAEGTAPPELLKRHRHHVVAINALDGTAQMVSNSTDNHAVHVTEETGEEVPGFPEATSRRYVVVVVEDEDD